MAPSRRKGASKAAAAAAAAACRQWKLGDLVLAKVKGFPAWPATVSEPERWGYSADWKKVCVHFFGTKQIAFCNPADVEAFTEEKKESLLVKRHGKGADFVRAVNEIIDSYEKLKHQEQVINVNSSDEVTVTITTKSVESLAKSGSKEEAPEATVKSIPKRFQSGRAKTERCYLKGAAAAIPEDASHHGGTLSEKPVHNLSIACLSKKELGGLQVHSCVAQRRAPSARRTRNSSRIDRSRFQNLMFTCSNGVASGGLAIEMSRDESVRRSKRIHNATDVSEGPNTNAPALVSNGSVDEDGSEIMTVDSDSLSLNEGSTVESGCEIPQPESIADHSGVGLELTQGLNFHTKAMIVKKKRKPNRKRGSNDSTELNASLDKGADPVIDRLERGPDLPSNIEKSNGICLKEDGDKHLPLVKRARVRMGRPLSTGEGVDSLTQMDTKPSDVLDNTSGKILSLTSAEYFPSDKDNSSLSNTSPITKAVVRDVKKNQLFASTVDVEAALPPSKRLHRALEAMSANVAEDGPTSPGAVSSEKMINNISSTNGCSNFSLENKTRKNGVNLGRNGSSSASQDGIYGFSFGSFPSLAEENMKHSVEVEVFSKSEMSNESEEHENSEDMLIDGKDGIDKKKIMTLSAGTGSPNHVSMVQGQAPLSSNLYKEGAKLECDQGCLLLSPGDCCKVENSGSGKSFKEADPSEGSRMTMEPVSVVIESMVCSAQNDGNMVVYSADINCHETSKLCKPALEGDNRENGMCDIVSEAKLTLEDSNVSPSAAPLKVVTAAVLGDKAISEDHSGDKAISGMRSCSSPTDGADSSTRTSPPTTSLVDISASDHSNYIENNGFCSPDSYLHHGKRRYVNKWSSRAEANAALTEFEAFLGTLTRTRESIGRATRAAIGCAKFGIASKVVEILARSLEREPALPRRVNLFFLVDSITQHSRGLNGDVSGLYPSAIQPVLTRLLLAAAPPESSAQENRRQCLKVLKLWQERKIFPDSIIRHHIQDLESLSSSSSARTFSRRPFRNERAFDDPIREMEGMLVDEYGSNSSFQLPGFRMPPMLKDEDEASDSDGDNFEAVTPEHISEIQEEQKKVLISSGEKHRHILEDVDGELEMEDVAPPCEAEIMSTGSAAMSGAQTLRHQYEPNFPPSFAPLPNDVPPSSPPLPTSPPPPPPPLLPSSSMPCSCESEHYMNACNSRDSSEQAIVHQSLGARANSRISNAVHYHTPENRDTRLKMQRHMQSSESSNSCSFGSQPVSRSPNHAMNGSHQADGAPLHNKAFHLRPPHPAPSNQFSYVQADHRERAQSRREIHAPSYPSRFHFVHDRDRGNFYSDHDRIKMAPRDRGESWRFTVPSFSGPAYGRAPYEGPPCESAIPNRWDIHPRAMNYRELRPHRLPSDGPIPVALRAPSYWRPR